MNCAARSANRGLSFRPSQVIPCTLVAPASISRSGLRKVWKWRCVSRRLTNSTPPISMTRWPSLGSRPVVSVSRTICRMMRKYNRERDSYCARDCLDRTGFGADARPRVLRRCMSPLLILRREAAQNDDFVREHWRSRTKSSLAAVAFDGGLDFVDGALDFFVGQVPIVGFRIGERQRLIHLRGKFAIRQRVGTP